MGKKLNRRLSRLRRNEGLKQNLIYSLIFSTGIIFGYTLNEILDSTEIIGKGESVKTKVIDILKIK